MRLAKLWASIGKPSRLQNTYSLAGLRFCPTGGIDAAKAPAYLALPNVACVGGSWMVPADAVKAGDWARIGALAAEAASLKRWSPTSSGSRST